MKTSKKYQLDPGDKLGRVWVTYLARRSQCKRLILALQRVSGDPRAVELRAVLHCDDDPGPSFSAQFMLGGFKRVFAEYHGLDDYWPGEEALVLALFSGPDRIYRELFGKDPPDEPASSAVLRFIQKLLEPPTSPSETIH